MQRDGFTLLVALLALVCWTAFSHGEDVHLFLLGVALADLAVVKFASINKIRRPQWAVSGLLALVATTAFWLALSQYFPAKAESSRLGPFLEGLVPSLALGGLLVWVFRGTQRR